MTTDPTRDIVELWTAVYGEPPSITTDHDLMLASLIEGLGGAPSIHDRRRQRSEQRDHRQDAEG